MQRTSGWRRGIASVVLVLSTAVAAFLPLADAYAERAAGTPQAHVEQPGSSQCPPAHDEIACQSCRVLRLASGGDVGDTTLLWLSAAAVTPQDLRAARRIAWFAPNTSPRAPPSA